MDTPITSSKVIPTFKSKQIHIWLAYFPDNYKHASYYESLLSPYEQQKMQSFRFPIDQQKYAISRGILRSLLGIYLKRDPQKIDILYGLWGKPCLSSQIPLYFNAIIP
jgi:4'-phosphopantetheinyl transferase